MRLLGPVFALLLSVALLLMGNGLQTTLLPIRAAIEQFAAYEIGVMGSAYFVGFALGCVLGPRLVRRAGHIRAFAAFVAIASTVAIAHPLLVDPYAWWVLRAITGFCFAVLYVVIESWLNERATNETRGLVMSIYIIVNFTSIAVGQLLIVTYDPALFPLFSIASILVSIAAVPVTMTNAAAPAPIEVVEIRPIKLYITAPVGLMGSFLVGIFNGAFWALGPTSIVAAGFSANQAAYFMSAAVAGGALMQYPLGRLSDRMDRRYVLLAICVIGACISFALFMRVPWIPIYAFGAIFGAFALPGYAIAAAHAYDLAKPEETVETSAGLLLVNGVGSIIGPLGAAALIETLGGYGLFAFVAGMQLVLAGFVIWRMRVRASVPQEDKTGFNLTNAAQVMAAVEMEEHHDQDPATGERDDIMPPPFPGESGRA